MKSIYVSFLASTALLSGLVFAQKNENYLYNVDEFLSNDMIQPLNGHLSDFFKAASF